MREVNIVGAGMVRFGKYDNKRLPWKTPEELGKDACIEAIKHAGVNHKKIEASYFGETLAGMPQISQRVLDYLGISGIPMYNHENACSTSLAAFRQAYFDVANGMYDIVLAAGVEKMTLVPATKGGGGGGGMGGLGALFGGGPIVMPEGMIFLQDVGGIMPAFFALLGRRHMEDYGTTKEQFARIAVKNHKHGALNPYSQYQQELSLEEVLNSRMVCDPITLLQCCPTGDGAAAVIIVSGDVARQYTTKPVKILDSIIYGGEYKCSKGIASTIGTCSKAAGIIYEKTGVGPEDIDVVEQHDCFTPHELVTYEDLGICPRGEGSRLIDEGATALGGKGPVFNASGGLQAKGHPIAATGVAQIVELVWQLRDECGKRQVEGARVGLAHNGGGVGPGFEPGLLSLVMLSR